MKIEMPRISEKLQDGGDLLTALERGDAENLLFKNQMISGEILEDVEIKGCIFQNCRILGGRLTRISVWDSSFRSCDFSNCVIEDGYFQRVEFLGCKLTGTSSVSSVLKDVYLEDCSCRMWNLSNATIKTVGFNRCDCTSAVFSMWDRKNLSFYESRFSGCNFFKTPLKDIDFSTCSIDGLMLSGEELKGAVIAAHQAQELVGLLGVKVK